VRSPALRLYAAALEASLVWSEAAVEVRVVMF